MARTKFIGLAFAAMLLVAAVSAQDAPAAAKAAAPAAADAAAAPKNAANAAAGAGDAAPAAAAAAPKATAAPKAAVQLSSSGKGKGFVGGPVHIPQARVHVPTFYLPMLVGKGARAERPQVNVTLPAKPVLPKPHFFTKGKGKGAN